MGVRINLQCFGFLLGFHACAIFADSFAAHTQRIGQRKKPIFVDTVSGRIPLRIQLHNLKTVSGRICLRIGISDSLSLCLYVSVSLSVCVCATLRLS